MPIGESAGFVCVALVFLCASARKYYEEALKLDPNGKYAPEADQALRKLKKK